MSKTTRTTVLWLALSAIFFAALPTVSAQNDRDLLAAMPADTFAFIRLSGLDSVWDEFTATSPGQIWQSQQFQQFYSQLESQLQAAIEKMPEEDRKGAGFVFNLVKFLPRKPLAAGLMSLPPDQQKTEVPFSMFLVVDAGQDKARLQGLLSEFEPPAEMVETRTIAGAAFKTLKQSDPPLYYGWVNNIFVISFNDSADRIVHGLARNRESLTLPARLRSGDFAGGYMLGWLDIQKLVAAIGSLPDVQDEDVAQVRTVLDRLGLSQVQYVATGTSFKDGKVVSDQFVAVPDTRKGIFSALGQVQPDIFRAVEPRAVTAAAMNVQPARFWDVALETIGAVAPEQKQQITQQIAQVEQQLGINIRQGLLGNLSGPMVLYTYPAMVAMEAQSGGAVLMAHVEDEEEFNRNLGQLEQVAQAIIQQQGGDAAGMLQIQVTSDPDRPEIHNWVVAPLAMAQIIPAWTVTNDHFVLASNRELAMKAISQLDGGQTVQSLIDQDWFKTLRPAMPSQAISIQVANSPVQFRQFLFQAQSFWPMLTMAARNAGIQLPAMLPYLDPVIQKIPPSVTYAQRTPDGLHAHYEGSGLEVSSAPIVVGAAAGAVVFPALTRAKSTAQKVVSVTELKNMGLAMHMYAMDNDNRFPPSLQTFAESEYIQELQESPRKPNDFTGPDYIYIEGQTTQSNSQNVLLYENPEMFDAHDEIGVLFLDGHVESMPYEQLKQRLTETYQRLGRAMPEFPNPAP